MEAPLLLTLIMLGSGMPTLAVVEGQATHHGITLEAVSPAPVESWARVVGWLTRPEDNLVGLRDPSTLSNPALVDFQALMDATPEMQQMRRDRVDPAGPQGIQLTNRARGRIASACERVMQSEGHCSVWKAISHTDGRAVPDLTAEVRALL